MKFLVICFFKNSLLIVFYPSIMNPLKNIGSSVGRIHLFCQLLLVCLDKFSVYRLIFQILILIELTWI